MNAFIYLNGEREDIKGNMSISKLLENKRIRPEMVVVELNGQIVDRERFEDTLFNKGDEVEFVYYMGGGSGLTIDDCKKFSNRQSET